MDDLHFGRDVPTIGLRYKVEGQSCDGCTAIEFVATYLGDERWDNGVEMHAEYLRLTEQRSG